MAGAVERRSRSGTQRAEHPAGSVRNFPLSCRARARRGETRPWLAQAEANLARGRPAAHWLEWCALRTFVAAGRRIDSSAVDPCAETPGCDHGIESCTQLR